MIKDGYLLKLTMSVAKNVKLSPQLKCKILPKVIKLVSKI